ncbi:hypothetical protein [Auritidibacter ignavus]|uniref:hypothetical protein n=1 Tax=Auritidibacter ignavus TaxID=678932 RepID=UPI000F02A18D|nr:hypothetical protein [Auritidibacter ignavus]NIH70476.1 hypothetical protein [Auritidibacter ignavus]RMX23333.1 hypothetical protein DYI20_05555 [Auritidibacter ignavus]
MQKRTVGPVTGASAVGGSLGAAIAQIIVHFAPSLQPVETAVTVIITAVLAVIGGWLVPSEDWERIMPEDETLFLDDTENPADLGLEEVEDLDVPEEPPADHAEPVSHGPSDLGVDPEDAENPT